ncbi:MAG: shikimate kinase [Acidobacteria bacterium]|nr:shikimate kinase [Acidobacteriota bacterium]
MMKSGSSRAVFLTGFMGAGKTTVGKALARRLGWRFVDLDRNIQAREGTSISKLFEQRGEPGFRRAESLALHHLLSGRKPLQATIVALGGGTLSVASNRRRLRQHGGPVVFLEAPLGALRDRCRRTGRKRPLFATGKRFRELYQARLRHYRKARLQVSTWRKQPQTVAAEVAAALGLGPTQEAG